MVTTLPGPSQFRGWMNTILLAFATILAVYSSYGQCQNTLLFPTTPIAASSFNDTVLVSPNSFAGDYFRVTGLSLNRTYTFLSSNPADFITIRNTNTNAVLGQGPVPFSYNVGSGPDLVEVHINLAVGCGTENINRLTRFVCSSCSAPAGRVGVNTGSPAATLDVAGEIRLGDAQRPPVAGMIRWNPSTSDFEGYNGTAWVSLTQSNAAAGQWGQVAPSTIQENTKLVASDGDAGDGFGSAVSINGDYAIIGASADRINGNNNQGSAYIFVRQGNTWVQQAKIAAADGSADDGFGNSVAISGDYAVVGARAHNTNGNLDQGAAYVFLRSGNNWIQNAKLVANDGASGDQFGSRVKISGNDIVVGAASDDIGASANQGSAYVFVRNGTNWVQQAKLVASDGAANDFFGNVSISGDYVVVGAPGDDIGASVDQGSAYVFFRTGTSWAQVVKLTAPDGDAFDDFGCSTGISGQWVIVGARSDDIGSTVNQGSAHIFRRDPLTWEHDKKLSLPLGSTAGAFGIDVAISNGFAIVGASNEQVNGTAIGSAFLYALTNTSWEFKSKFVPSDGALNDSFGFSVDMNSNHAIIGAFQGDVGPVFNQGAAYIIKKN